LSVTGRTGACGNTNRIDSDDGSRISSTIGTKSLPSAPRPCSQIIAASGGRRPEFDGERSEGTAFTGTPSPCNGGGRPASYRGPRLGRRRSGERVPHAGAGADLDWSPPLRKTTRLKQLIAAPQIVVLPGVHDALGVRLAEAAGFDALTAGGYGATATLLGRPDSSQLSLTELADMYSRFCDATSLPLLADADTGFGNVTNVARAVHLYEKAGVAGLFIEDQVFRSAAATWRARRSSPCRVDREDQGCARRARGPDS
jgi:hypothetical protein